MDFALTRLARRPHSEGELGAKMRRAGFPALEIGRTLSELRARRYLDDLAFARQLARLAAERKHWGPARIAQSLRRKEVTDHHIRTVLAEIFPSGEDEFVQRALARYRRLSRKGLNSVLERARAYRHLRARGFSPDVVRQVLVREGVGRGTGGEKNL